MTVAQLTHGSTVEWSTDGTTFTAIKEAKTLVVPTPEVEYVDVTHIQSPNRSREYIPGLEDTGEISVECNYTPEIYELAHGYRANQTLIYFRTTMPVFEGQSTGDVFEFTGYVTPAIAQSPVNEAVMVTLTIKVTGGLTHTPGAT